MRVHPLKPQQPPAAAWLRTMAGLIETVGLDAFPRKLFRAARVIAGCEHMTAFAFTEDASPRRLIAENIGEQPVASKVADRFLSLYWQRDPVWDALADLPKSEDLHAIEVGADEIRCPDYRADCYTSLRLRSRLAISQARGGRSVRLNFMFSDGVGCDHRALVLNSLDLLMPLLWRHEAALRPRHDDPRDGFRRRLAQREPRLSGRELDVCMLIAVGLSSEGIALGLGLSLNTVLTYRKRAYARIGISSQNELLRCVMM